MFSYTVVQCHEGWSSGFDCLWSLTVLYAQLSITFSAITTKPKNTLSYFGNATRIECSRNPSEVPIDWEFSSIQGGFKYIYKNRRFNESLSSRYRIDTDNRARYDIVIDSVDFSHAGTYRCTGGLTSASAQLTVLGSDPVCETNASASGTVEGNYIKMGCKVNHAGWYANIVDSRSEGSNTCPCSHVGANSWIMTRLTPKDNGVTFTWKTTISWAFRHFPKANETIDTDGIDYQYFWNFTLNVLYGPRNLTIQPKGVIYEVGDRLTCSAVGNPNPTFLWTENTTNRVVDGPILTISNNMPRMHQMIFTCTATNTLAGRNSKVSDVVKVIITEAPSSQNPATGSAEMSYDTNPVAVGVGTVTGLLILGFSIALTVKFCARGIHKKDRESSIEDQNYDVVDESKIQSVYKESGYRLQNQNAAQGDVSADYVAREGYTSLKHNFSATLAQPAVYAELQLHSARSSNDE